MQSHMEEAGLRSPWTAWSRECFRHRVAPKVSTSSSLSRCGRATPNLVADNISIARAAPVRAGDDVTVRGELAIDPSGPVIHWTHHDTRGRHESGFVRLNGVLYD